jgi:hypothetical protein
MMLGQMAQVGREGSVVACVAVNVAVIGATALAVGCSHPSCPEVVRSSLLPPDLPPAIESSKPLAVIGDLQGPMFVDFLLSRENNRRATGELVCQLGSDQPCATVLLGDLVAWGASEDSWARFDELASRINGMFLPVRGNHDYFGDDRSATALWNRHFPWFDRLPWYEVAWNRIGMVFLDSNLSQFEPAAQTAQQSWYQRVLDQFDQDPLIVGTLVFLHHPPYTNNPNAQGDLEALREAFVSPFCRHPKALAMISGHAHGYERYAKTCMGRAVQFIVSGGGGGPRPSDPPCFNDACLASGCCEPKSRPLHYLLLRQQPRGLEVTVQAQSVDQARGVLEVVGIPYPDQSASLPVSSVCERQKAPQVTQCPAGG